MDIRVLDILSHPGFVDVNIKVMDILQENEELIQLSVLYVHKTNPVVFNFGKPDFITIQKKDLYKWHLQ